MANQKHNEPANHDAPPPSRIVAELVRHPVRTSYVGELAQAVVRVPPYILSTIDEMAKVSGRSRNLLMTLLLQEGIEQSLSYLSEHERKRFERVPYPPQGESGESAEITQGEL